MSGASSPSMSPAQQNLMARNLILYGGGGFAPAQDIWQEITGFTLPSTPGPGSQYSVYLRPVGLVKRMIVEFSMTVTATAGGANNLVATALGAANTFSNFTFYDLSNYTRINTPQWHLEFVSTAKRRRLFGGVIPSQPYGFGNNFPTSAQSAVALAGGANATISGFVEIPIAYNDDDLRGAVYASVTQATMLLQFTINPNFFSAVGGDSVQSVYGVPSGGTAGALSNVKVRVYQNYLDKLPMAQVQGGGVVPILPSDDISRANLLTNSVWTSIAVNSDVMIPFVNSREFQSVTLINDNAGVLNAGTDLNYLMIQSANLTPLDKVDPFMHAFRTRTMFGTDPPAGIYYWDFRRRPIDTNQSGNTQLVVNPSAVTSGNQYLIGWESIGQLGLVNAAGAIPSQ